MTKTVSYAQWSLEPYCIGQKLRSLRTQKRLTLSRLAAETGLSTALLSKLETDRMIPTLQPGVRGGHELLFRGTGAAYAFNHAQSPLAGPRAGDGAGDIYAVERGV